MCIFHVLTVRGLSGSEGASTPCMGLPGNAEAPLAMRLCLHIALHADTFIWHVWDQKDSHTI